MTGVAVDSSALVALVFDEEDSDSLLSSILAAPVRRISSSSLLETGLVVASRKGAAGQAVLDSLVEDLELEIVSFDAEQVRVARDAWSRFGKGRHGAALNIGDCCSYALAHTEGLPLLCKGDDFPQTDLELVQWS